MALDISALLTSDGNHAQADHMFAGKASNMVAMADVLGVMHCENRRLRAVPALTSRFRNGATYPISYVQLTKAKYRVLVDAITDFGQSMPKITKAYRLTDLLTNSACIYWSEPFMDDKTADRVISASLDYSSRNTFFALLVPVVGWGLGWLLSFALARSIQSKTGAAFCHRLRPVVGVLTALPLAYKLIFSA